MRLARLSYTTAIVAALAAAPARASDIVPPTVYTTTPTGVNLADGSFVYTVTDISIGTLTLERFHLGGQRDPNDPFFGPRMSHNYDIFVSPNTTGAVGTTLYSRYKPIVHLGTSASGTYYQDRTATPTVSPSSDDAHSADLTIVGGAYVYTTNDGTKYTFNPSVSAAGSLNSQRIATIDFPTGRRQSFSYNGSGQLKLVSDTSGYALVFDYNTSGTVSTACGFNLAQTYVTAASTCMAASLKTTYGYTSGKLTSVTDVTGAITTYSYSGNEIACITPPSPPTPTFCKIANTYSAWKVVQQTLADNSVWKFQYSGSYGRDPEAYAEIEPTSDTVVTKPDDKVQRYTFVNSSPYTFTDENNRTWSYRYTGGNDYEGDLYPSPKPKLATGTMLVEATEPEENSYTAEYYGPHNVISKATLKAKPGTGLADRSTTYAYSCVDNTVPITPTCSKPIAVTDARGNTTNFAYESFGAVKSELQPAPTAGAARPLKLYTYVQSSAYVKNAGGSLVSTGQPIWLPASETWCETAPGGTTPTCGSGSLQVVTTYEYGTGAVADNLLLRGKVVTAGGVSLRTCYGYDAQGNRIWQTTPRGTSTAVCA